jgi:hypothetical protein
MLNIKFGADAVGAGAVSRCSFDYTKFMWLLAAPAPQHCLVWISIFYIPQENSTIERQQLV